jgi:hypothetical protein
MVRSQHDRGGDAEREPYAEIARSVGSPRAVRPHRKRVGRVGETTDATRSNAAAVKSVAGIAAVAARVTQVDQFFETARGLIRPLQKERARQTRSRGGPSVASRAARILCQVARADLALTHPCGQQDHGEVPIMRLLR